MNGAANKLAADSGTAPAVVLSSVPPDLLHEVEAFCAAPTLRKRSASFVHLVLDLRAGRRDSRLKLQMLVEWLEADPETRLRFQQSFGKLLVELDSVPLFAEVGIPSIHSFPSEVAHRLAGKLLPSARQDRDASRLLINLYSTEQAATQFSAVPDELFQRLVTVLTPEDAGDFWQHQVRDLQEAMRLLASRVCGLGLAPEMRDRSTSAGISVSPFYQLLPVTEELLGMGSAENNNAAVQTWRSVVRRCHAELRAVHHHMESAGVSVELMFDLRTIQACLQRMETIASVLTTAGEQRARAIRGLVQTLIEGNIADKKISSLLRENLNLVARKVVDRTGDTGEHYIANNKAEYRKMWLAAFGGGLLTVFTAAIKMRIIDAQLPPFVEGFASGTNYAVSFILLQVFGLVLATKQPATTAATFAGIIRDSRGKQRSSKLADFVSHITSTQLAAAMGNVIAVSIGCVLFERLWRVFFAHSYLPQASATHVYETLHPFASGTAFYAAITGVILWLAALAGSWIENAAVYYRLTDAIAQHPLGLRLGEVRMTKLARTVKHNLGGWATSIVLGYLLGFTPVIGHFFGLPLDIRHVTLSSGTLALAAARFGTASLGDRWFYHAVEGIAVIFVLNLFVSFSIAGFVALRAYDVRPREQLRILRSLIRDGLRSPLRFIVPKYDAGSTAKADDSVATAKEAATSD